MTPILFNLFINDINGILDECFCGPASMGNLKLNNLLYVDNLILKYLKYLKLEQVYKVA